MPIRQSKSAKAKASPTPVLPPRILGPLPAKSWHCMEPCEFRFAVWEVEGGKAQVGYKSYTSRDVFPLPLKWSLTPAAVALITDTIGEIEPLTASKPCAEIARFWKLENAIDKGEVEQPLEAKAEPKKRGRKAKADDETDDDAEELLNVVETDEEEEEETLTDEKEEEDDEEIYDEESLAEEDWWENGGRESAYERENTDDDW